MVVNPERGPTPDAAYLYDRQEMRLAVVASLSENCHLYSPVAQLVEQHSDTVKVKGSIPFWTTNIVVGV